MKEQYYIISAENLKLLLINTLGVAKQFSYADAKEIANRQINDMIAAREITPTIFEKE